jgi:glycosyltransferase involved in cell wall biosynthesis
MRIVMAANWWYRRGGLGAVMLDEADGLVARGHEIIPFAAAHPENLPTTWDTYFPPFVETSTGGRELALAERVTAALDLIHDRRAATSFERLLTTVQPDVVHLHGPARQLSPSIVGVAVRLKVPVVMSLHDSSLICPQGLLLRGGTTPCVPPNCNRGNVTHAVTNRCLQDSAVVSAVGAVEHLVHRAFGSYTRRTDRFITPSQFLARTVVEAGVAAQRVVVLPNGINPGREPSPLPFEGGHVLYAGRLSREKGLPHLLAAAARLTDVPFVLAGDGPDRAMLEASAPPNVSFVGHLGSSALAEQREGAVVAVSPSTCYENAPLAVLESMRSARPVVATDIGGQPELLRTGGGLLVPDADPVSLATAIDRLWRDRDAAARMGREGRAALVARYSLDRHLDGLLGIYGAVVEGA